MDGREDNAIFQNDGNNDELDNKDIHSDVLMK